MYRHISARGRTITPFLIAALRRLRSKSVVQEYPQGYGEALSPRFEAVVVGLCGRFEERDVLAQAARLRPSCVTPSHVAIVRMAASPARPGPPGVNWSSSGARVRDLVLDAADELITRAVMEADKGWNRLPAGLAGSANVSRRSRPRLSSYVAHVLQGLVEQVTSSN